MGHIVLEGIEAWGHHGVLPEELDRGQPFVADVRLDVDTSAAAESDDLADAVDYSTVARAVHGVMAGEPVALLETLVSRILDVVMADDRVREAEVRVCKPRAPVDVPIARVCVERRRRRA